MNSQKLHWDTVYQNKDKREMSWYQEIPYTSLSLISNLDLTLHSPIIDVGGGNSNFTKELYHDGFADLTVIDISRAAIAKKQEELGVISNNINWIVGNVLDFNSESEFQLWHDRAAFHFFTDEEDIQKYIELVNRHVAYGGFMIVSTFSEAGPEKCSGLPVMRYSVEALKALFSEQFRLMRGFEETHITPIDTEQRFVYTLFRKIA